MRRMIRNAALAGLVLPAAALADTVRLRSGDVVEGSVKDLGDRIEVDAKGGAVSLRWADEVVVMRAQTTIGV